MTTINVNIDMDDQGRVYSGMPLDHFKIQDNRDVSMFIKNPAQRAYFKSHPKMIELYYKDTSYGETRYYLPRGAYKSDRAKGILTGAPLAALDEIADELYDYQYKAVEAMINSIYTSAGGLIVSDTGTGKTRMIRALAKCMNKPIVFVTPNITIQKNAVNSFEERGMELIAINGTQEPGAIDPNKSYACHYKTLDMNYDQLNDGNRILICDEAHMCPCDTLLKAICLWRNDDPTTCVFGVTATPYRQEFGEEGFERIFGTIFKTGAKALPCKVLRFKRQRQYTVDYMMECKGNLPTDSYEIYRNMLNNDEARTQEIVDLALRCYHKNESGKVIIFTDRVEYAENLNERIKKTGCQDTILHIGKTSKQDLQKTLENKSQYIIVGSVGCCGEGLDLPSLTTGILTFNTSNQKSLAQMAGRVRRNFPGKEVGFLIDIADIIQVGGGKKYYGGISKRANIYNELGFELQDM